MPATRGSQRSTEPDEDGYVSAEDADYVPGEDEPRKRKRPASAAGRRALGVRAGGIALSDDEADGSSSSGEDEPEPEAEEAELTPAERRKRARADAAWRELSGGAGAGAAVAAVSAGASAGAKKSGKKAAKKGKKAAALKAALLKSGTWELSAAAVRGERVHEFRLPGEARPAKAAKKKSAKTAKTAKTAKKKKKQRLSIPGLVSPAGAAAAAAETPEADADETPEAGGRRKRARSAVSSAALAAARAAKASDEVTVTETVRFAGKTTTVTRTLRSGEELRAHEAKQAAAAAAVPATGLDKVLSSMKAPKGISTVAKSSADWDQFKTDEGIAQELDQETRDGYLARQNFLQRVDERQFEQEKEERARQRAKRQR